MGFQLGLFSWEGFSSHTGSSQREGGGGGVQLWYHCMAFFPYFFTFLAHIFKDCGEGVAHLVRFFALSFYTQLFCLSFSLVFSSTLVS